jgi:alkaline phosphatase D
MDNTFGPVVAFQKGCSLEQGENLAPCFGMQFFGRVDIDGRSGVMTVTLKDVDNRDLWSVDIEPRPDARPNRVLSQQF